MPNGLKESVIQGLCCKPLHWKLLLSIQTVSIASATLPQFLLSKFYHPTPEYLKQLFPTCIFQFRVKFPHKVLNKCLMKIT